MPRRHQGAHGHSAQGDEHAIMAWVERELKGCEFKDDRLERRLRELLARLASSPGGSIPFACQDWASTKAAYRFLVSVRVRRER